jgi:hypothetical protein
MVCHGQICSSFGAVHISVVDTVLTVFFQAKTPGMNWTFQFFFCFTDGGHADVIRPPLSFFCFPPLHRQASCLLKPT